jgi:Halocarboxylic acid dehydrogenase DehI
MFVESGNPGVGELPVMRRVEQIEESAATGGVAAFYEDFKETMPSSFVPTVFRSLARFPTYLQPAWKELGPALGTTYADLAAAALRARMRDRMETVVADRARALPELSPADHGEILAVLEIFATVLPKSWLGILALGEAWSGRPIDGLTRRTADECRPAARVASASMPSIPVLDQDPDDPRVQKIFAATQTRLKRLAVPNIYRTLARWPDYLEAVWEQVIDAEILSGIEVALPDLTQRAVEAVHGLPCVLSLDRSAAESRLPAGAADEIETILKTYRKTMPETALQIFGLLRGLAETRC